MTVLHCLGMKKKEPKTVSKPKVSRLEAPALPKLEPSLLKWLDSRTGVIGSSLDSPHAARLLGVDRTQLTHLFRGRIRVGNRLFWRFVKLFGADPEEFQKLIEAKSESKWKEFLDVSRTRSERAKSRGRSGSVRKSAA